jgi:hypothetical protein
MPDVELFRPGNYRFVTHAFQYSGGVEALEGYAVERVRFVKPLKLADGFAAAQAHMARLGRPPTSFCACELRSPGQFTDQGFIDFNRHYVQQLAAWGIFHDEVNPVARSNVCPEIDPPSEPSFYAFSYTVPGQGGFVVAGSGEAGGSGGPYGGRIVRLGDQSPDAMREKARFVLGAMEERMGKLGKPGPTSPRRSSTRSSISTRISPTNSSAAARHPAGLPGIMPARRCRGSTTRSTCAASRRNW